MIISIPHNIMHKVKVESTSSMIMDSTMILMYKRMRLKWMLNWQLVKMKKNKSSINQWDY